MKIVNQNSQNAKNRRKVFRRSHKKEKIILMPAEQFKSTLTKHVGVNF